MRGFPYFEDEQYEEEQQDDLNADDEQLREEVSQHRFQRAHAWYKSNTLFTTDSSNVMVENPTE